MRSNLTCQDMAERFGVSLEMVRQNVRTSRWPHLRIGESTIRFTEAQAEEIEKLITVKPITSGRDRRHKRDRASVDDKVRLLISRGEASA